MALQHAGEYFNKGWQKYFLIIFMLMAVVHTMVFSTYEVDIFAGTAHHPSYEAAQVFNGDMKEYYRDFSLFDSMNRSHCIYLSALQQWALVKHKQISIDAQRSAHCSQMIGHDPAAAYQAAYIAVEMPLGK